MLPRVLLFIELVKSPRASGDCLVSLFGVVCRLFAVGGVFSCSILSGERPCSVASLLDVHLVKVA